MDCNYLRNISGLTNVYLVLVITPDLTHNYKSNIINIRPFCSSNRNSGLGGEKMKRENDDIILSLGVKTTIIRGLTCLDKHGHFTVTKGNESDYVGLDLLNSFLCYRLT